MGNVSHQGTMSQLESTETQCADPHPTPIVIITPHHPHSRLENHGILKGAVMPLMMAMEGSKALELWTLKKHQPLQYVMV